MVERIANTLFLIHVGRFIWYAKLWSWCWEHDAPIFITRLLVMLIKVNAKTARIIYASKSRKEGTNDQA